jgi:hypothetical protein
VIILQAIGDVTCRYVIRDAASVAGVTRNGSCTRRKSFEMATVAQAAALMLSAGEQAAARLGVASPAWQMPLSAAV